MCEHEVFILFQRTDHSVTETRAEFMIVCSFIFVLKLRNFL